MFPLRTNTWRRAAARLGRYRVTVVLAVVIALTASGTAGAAVTYVVLGGTNQTNATTILRSNVNGTVLQVTNFDTTGGVSARGINITVPAGRAPLTVNSTASKATNLNADMVDGLNANAFLGVNQMAANANLLDGKDSTSFMTGPGKVVRGAIALSPGSNSPVASVANFWTVFYQCPATVTSNGLVYLYNATGEQINVFIDNGGGNPEYVQVEPGIAFSRGAAATGEGVVFHVHSPSRGIAEISVFTANRPATPDCHAQLLAVISGP